MNRLLKKHPLALGWLSLWLGGSALLSIAAAFHAISISEHQLASSLLAPTLAHPLGCDAFGRDLLLTSK
jgi:ABC-type dipeptide/oligopeptide/nickel transport system permease subunit